MTYGLFRSIAWMAVLLVGIGMTPLKRPARARVDLQRLLAHHDYFRLRRALDSLSGPPSADQQFYQAAVLAAFDRPRASDSVIDVVMATRPAPARAAALLYMRMQNQLQRSRYARGLQSADELLERYAGTGKAADIKEARHLVRLLKAVADAGPQEVVRHGSSRIELKLDKRLGHCVPVHLGGQARCYILDSGANFSTLIRSEARRLGLTIRKAGISVTGASGVSVLADAAVAPVLRIGNLEFHNVLFLVFPDKAFTVGDFQIPGILGYQIVAGMGRVTYAGSQVLEVPGAIPADTEQNLALDGRTLLTQVSVHGRRILCQLDTGNPRTVFYSGYYATDKDYIQSIGSLRKVRIAGAGGVRELRAWHVPKLEVGLAGKTITLTGVDVYPGFAPPHARYLMCNVGLDAVSRFSSYTIDLVNMSLTLNR